MQKYNGFSLVEVMFTALIVSIGVSGFAVLQSKLAQSYENTQLRQIATQLAASKLNDLRQFSSNRGYLPGPSYSQVSTNNGGTIPSGELSVWLNRDQQIEHTFDLSWAVYEQFLVDTDDDNQTDTWVTAESVLAPNPLPQHPPRKQVLVTVIWSDHQGRAKQFSLEGIVIPLHGNANRLEFEYADGPIRKPVVSEMTEPQVYQSIPEQDNIIEHFSLSSRLSQEPESVSTVKVKRRENDNSLFSKDEFKTLACSCTLQGEGQGKTPATHQLRNGQLAFQEGRLTTKPIGSATENQQSLCDICCRDHHDTLAMLRNGDSYRQQTVSPHSHFLRSQTDSYVRATRAGDRYDEVCRFRREQGIFHLTHDWHAISSVIMPSEIDETALSRYQAFIEEALQSHVLGLHIPVSPFSRDMTLDTTKHQLHSRTLYLDAISSADSVYIAQQIETEHPGWQSLLAFYDLDSTLQSQWLSSDPETIHISNQPSNLTIDLANQGFGTFSRGVLTGIDSGQVNIGAKILVSNAGVLGTPAITPEEHHQELSTQGMRVRYHATDNMRSLSGLIHCIDNRFASPKMCNPLHQDRSDFVDLASLAIQTTPSSGQCAVTFPILGSPGFFVCPEVVSNWSGVVGVNTDDLPLSLEAFWLTPRDARIDSTVAPVSEISANPIQGQFQLVIQVN